MRNRVKYIIDLDDSGPLYCTDLGVCEHIFKHIGGGHFPGNFAIYHSQIADHCLVPLNSEEEIQKANELVGDFFVTNVPGNPIHILIAAVGSIAAVAIGFLPKPPSLTAGNINSESPNNGLSERQNAARLNARVPDIVGKVVATPDLLQRPYNFYVNNQEVEHAFMCIGIGSYEVAPETVKDDQTRVDELDKIVVRIYGPNTSPNSGDDPELTVGSETTTETIKTVYHLSSVNGQTLHPPNKLPSGVLSEWVGPFTISNAKLEEIYSNFVALQGLYTDDGETQSAASATVELEITPLDLDNEATGPAVVYSQVLTGSSSEKTTVGVTKKLTSLTASRYRVRARRSTNTDLAFEGSVVDEIKWKSVFGFHSIPDTHFGNITTVQAITYATEGALAVKSRKLNMSVTRILPELNPDGTLGESAPTQLAKDILPYLAMSENIGDDISSLDLVDLYAQHERLVDYFGDSEFTQFNYTFDKNQLTYEQAVKLVSTCIFCEPYRQGSVIKFKPILKTNTPVLLFGHRNKIPETESRSYIFGEASEFDGVELQWTDPVDNSKVSLFVPDNTRSSYKTLEVPGLSSALQAYVHAWRAWYRIMHHNILVSFDATSEAEILTKDDIVYSAKNVMASSLEGEVKAVDGLLLTLTGNLKDLIVGEKYFVFLQYSDGTVGNIGCHYQGFNIIKLLKPTRLPLVTEQSRYAKTTYILTLAEDDDSSAPIKMWVSEVAYAGEGRIQLTLSNYDDRVFARDLDALNGYVSSSNSGDTTEIDVYLPANVDPSTGRDNSIGVDGTRLYVR